MPVKKAADDYDDVDLESDVDLDDDSDDDGVPEHLQFTATVETDDDEDAKGPLTITIDGLTVTLVPPSDTALAIRYAEYQGAETVMDQALALIGLLSTAMDRTSYIYLRQQLLAPRQSGKKFNDSLLSDLAELILERWGGGEKVQRDQDKPVGRPRGNRQQRRNRR